jgi:hypothetical protein
MNVSRQLKPLLVREPSAVQNVRIVLKKCLKPSSSMPICSLGKAILISGPRRYGTYGASLFISYTTNELLFIFRCNIFIGFRIIKEMPGFVASGTPCIYIYIPGGGEIFRTRPDRPSGPPSLQYNGYRVIPGGKAVGAWC